LVAALNRASGALTSTSRDCRSADEGGEGDEKEEEERELNGFYDDEISEDDEEMTEIRGLARQIRKKKKLMRNDAFMVKSSNKPKIPRTARKRERSVSRFTSELRSIGVDISSDEEGHFQDATEEKYRPPLKRKREDSEGQVRSSSKMPRDRSGIRDVVVQQKVKKMGRKAQIPMARNARKGEGDRHIPDRKPKHLFSGKRTNGTHSSR